MGEDDIVRFPHCVVEVKLQVEETPSWLQACISDSAPRSLHSLHSGFAAAVACSDLWYENIRYLPSMLVELHTL